MAINLLRRPREVSQLKVREEVLYFKDSRGSATDVSSTIILRIFFRYVTFPADDFIWISGSVVIVFVFECVTAGSMLT